MTKRVSDDALAKLDSLGIRTSSAKANAELSQRFYSCDHPQRRVPGEILARLQFALAQLQTLKRGEFIKGEFARVDTLKRNEWGELVMVADEKFNPPKSQRIGDDEERVLLEIIELATALCHKNANGRSGGPAIQ